MIGLYLDFLIRSYDFLIRLKISNKVQWTVGSYIMYLYYICVGWIFPRLLSLRGWFKKSWDPLGILREHSCDKLLHFPVSMNLELLCGGLPALGKLWNTIDKPFSYIVFRRTGRLLLTQIDDHTKKDLAVLWRGPSRMERGQGNATDVSTLFSSILRAAGLLQPFDGSNSVMKRKWLNLRNGSNWVKREFVAEFVQLLVEILEWEPVETDLHSTRSPHRDRIAYALL